jgi:signal transduction histidine kinase
MDAVQESTNSSTTVTESHPAMPPVRRYDHTESAIVSCLQPIRTNASDRDVPSCLQEFVDASSIATLLFEADGRVIYANRAARIFAWMLNPDKRGEEPRMVRDWHPDLLPAHALLSARERGTWIGEIVLGGPSEQHRVLLAQISALGTKRTAPYGLSVRDITLEYGREAELHQRNIDLELAYARLKDVQEQVIQSEKLASIGQLAAGVAHEINNPIGYVKSNLNSLQQYIGQLLAAMRAYAAAAAAPGDAAAAAVVEHVCRQCDLDFLATDVQQLLDESRDGIDRVCKIVRDLKDFSRRDHLDDWVRADVHEGLESTLNIVWNELKYKAQVVKTLGELPLIECLPSELNQVFMNILINAGQAIKTQGIITVSSERCGDKVRICIGDDGEGIPADLLPRIFDPFFTTKPVGQGTGLGLSLSYNIVRKHGGHIDVRSAPGAGATFRIVLPLRQAERGDDATRDAVEPA